MEVLTPRSLDEALAIKAERPDVLPIQGGTDVMVDVNFDRQYRKERPIPAGAISLKSVWLLGLAWLFFGVIILLWLGKLTGALGWALVFCIVLYDAIHKRIELSPVLMGLCRFFLYLIAASAGERGLTAASIWCGLALAAYVVGLSYLARRESAGGPLKFWSVFFLAVPVLVAIFKNPNGYSEGRFLLCEASLTIRLTGSPLNWPSR